MFSTLASTVGSKPNSLGLRSDFQSTVPTSLQVAQMMRIIDAAVIVRNNFVGVLAETEYAAMLAVRQLKVQWKDGTDLPVRGE
jgi:hypothetical protein